MIDPRRFFDAIARRYDRVYAPDGAASRARMKRVLELLPPASRVLDLGVGTGRELPALLDAGHAPVGMDASAAMLALCDRRARKVPLVCADFFEPLPFDPSSFEAALALHGTLAHPPNEDAVARLALELARVLCDDGVMIAEVPTQAWLRALGPGVDDGERRARPIADDRCVYEDVVVGASIEAWIPDESRWRAPFEAAGFAVTFERVDTGEARLVARRPNRATLLR